MSIYYDFSRPSNGMPFTVRWDVELIATRDLRADWFFSRIVYSSKLAEDDEVAIEHSLFGIRCLAAFGLALRNTK